MNIAFFTEIVLLASIGCVRASASDVPFDGDALLRGKYTLHALASRPVEVRQALYDLLNTGLPYSDPGVQEEIRYAIGMMEKVEGELNKRGYTAGMSEEKLFKVLLGDEVVLKEVIGEIEMVRAFKIYSKNADKDVVDNPSHRAYLGIMVQGLEKYSEQIQELYFEKEGLIGHHPDAVDRVQSLGDDEEKYVMCSLV